MPLFGPPSISKLQAKGDTAGLLKVLRSRKDADERREAAVALGVLADARAIGPLIGTLRDSNQEVVQAAIDALVQFGPDALTPLLAALGDEDYRYRAASAWALGQISEDLYDSTLRWRSTEMLIASLRDDHELVREASARALARTADPRAVKPLRDVLSDSHAVVRIAAAFALAQIGMTSNEESVRRQVAAQLAIALEDSDVNVRQTAARAIGDVGAGLQNGDLKDSVMTRLGAALNDPDPAVGSAVADALGSVADGRAVRPLFNMGLSQDAEKELRDRALEAIVRIGAPAVDELEPMLLSIDHTVRDQAANILDRIGWIPDQGREAAAYWLAKRKWDKCIALGEPAADVLAVEIASDDPETRVRAGEALVSIGEPAVDAILRLLGDDDASIRERAAELLDQIGWEPCPDEAGAIYWVTKGCWNQALEIGPSAIRPIVRALRIGDFNTRQAAAYALETSLLLEAD